MPHKLEPSIISLITAALDYSDIGICICEKNGTIQYLNDNSIKILQIANKDAIIGKNLCGFIQAYGNLLEKVIKERRIKNYAIAANITENSIELDNKNPTITWIYNDAFIAANGSEECVVIVLKDYSFMKNIELDLIKYERKLNSIIEAIPDIVYRVNPDGIITFISDSISEYGYTPDELIGTNIIDLVHPEDKEKAFYVLKERRTGVRKTLAFEVRLLTKKGNIEFEFEDQFITDSKFFLVSSEGIYVPKYEKCQAFIGTQGVARDITSKRYHELILKKTDARWKGVLDSINDGYYECDANGNFIYINKALADMLGYTADEIMGKNYKEFVHQADEKMIMTGGVETLIAREDATLENWVIMRKDNKKRYVESSINRIVDKNGAIAGFRGIMRDMTEKHKLEKEILRFRKLEAIGILAGGIAHDYNNALTAILGNLSLAKMEVDPSCRGLVEVLDDAETASMKIMELTRQLSDFAQGGRPLRKVVVITSMIKETVDTALHDYNGEYELHIQDDLWPVDIDSDQVSHVVELMLQNAREAMANKGKMCITVRNKTVDEETTRYAMSLQADDYVVIEIKDEGMGISNEVIDKIFDPYFTTKDFASGMGLAISFAIIKRHHGFIGVETEPGKGATFSIYLPSAGIK